MRQMSIDRVRMADGHGWGQKTTMARCRAYEHGGQAQQRKIKVTRLQAMGGLALLGAGFMAAIASGGGPDTVMTGEVVALSVTGVGMMLLGLGMVMRADAKEQGYTSHGRRISPNGYRIK